jgi:CHAT domain-containing protein
VNPFAGASNPGPRIDPDNPPYRELRELLQAAFEPETLRRFCREDRRFRPLLDRFAYNAGLLDMIDEVLEFCRTQLLWEEFLDAVAEHSPRHYNRFAAQMGWPQVSEPGRGEPTRGAARADHEPAPAEEAELSSPSDVEIHVGIGAEGRYPVTIQTPQAGEASVNLDLRWPADQLRAWLAQLEDEQADRQHQAEIGQNLFRALFHEAIRDLYMKAVGRSRTGLRLRLWFDGPELQALPWELLYDAVHGEFLALSEQCLVTRYLPVPLGEPPLTVTPPLRVLVATASPQGHPALGVEAEAAAVEEALAPLATRGQAQVRILHHAQVTTLRRTLWDYDPHVFHFSGHSTAGPDGGALLLEDEAGDARLLGAHDLSLLLQHGNVRLAVLNACLTARGAPVEAAALDRQRRAVLGVGPALVQAGLGAVVAMQFSLSDAAARLFARDFYDTVARLEPVDLAVARARGILALESGRDSRDWATPVLFLRAPDGVIFA